MKTGFLSLMAVAGAMVSCETVNREIPVTPSSVTWEDVTFSVQGAAVSKSIAAEDAAEATINDLQVLVYDSSDRLVTFGRSSSSQVTMSVPVGVEGHAVCAAVNVSDDLSSYASSNALTQRISKLKDNELSGLEMFGMQARVKFVKDKSVDLTVTRFASKVCLKELTAEFTGASQRSQKFELVGIYLINVNGTCPFSRVPAAGTWYNRLKREAGDADALIADVMQTPVTVQGADGTVTPYLTAHTFYCYPNPTETDVHGGTFSPRFTRLVVEARLGTQTYYYPVDIVSAETGNLPMNTSFTINKLVITGPGVLNPDDKLDKSSVKFTVDVAPWAEGFNKDVTY